MIFPVQAFAARMISFAAMSPASVWTMKRGPVHLVFQPLDGGHPHSFVNVRACVFRRQRHAAHEFGGLHRAVARGLTIKP
ncbi:MAG: hypothetical protein HND47_09925 [Chloroflexi bacterium]|nr:hypothetical protein [Chloroflexota bacterium]